jgi:hypothetical protein
LETAKNVERRLEEMMVASKVALYVLLCATRDMPKGGNWCSKIVKWSILQKEVGHIVKAVCF